MKHYFLSTKKNKRDQKVKRKLPILDTLPSKLAQCERERERERKVNYVRDSFGALIHEDFFFY